LHKHLSQVDNILYEHKIVYFYACIKISSWCCDKFKKPMGNPGDPKRDMILRPADSAGDPQEISILYYGC